MTSVHNFSKKISQIFPGNSIISFQIVVKNIHTDNKISCIKWVDFVPSLKKMIDKAIVKQL